MTQAPRAATVAVWWPWLALPAAASSAVAVGLTLAAVQHRHIDTNAWQLPPLAVGFSTIAAGIWATGPHALGLRRLALVYTTIGVSAAASLPAFGWARADLPGATAASWLTTWIWALAFAPLFALAVILHPDGRLPSHKWWPAPLVGAVGILALVASGMARPGSMEAMPSRTNPTGVLSTQVWDVVGLVGFILVVLAAFAGLAGLTLKFRRAPRGGDVRGQIGSFAAASALLVTVVAALSEVQNLMSAMLLFTLAAAVPITVGVGVLRHNLLDPSAQVAELTSRLDRVTVARRRLVREREAERARLRRELHDGLGPSLAAIAIGLRNAEEDAGGSSQLKVLGDEVRRAVDEVRRICEGLRPAALGDLSLAQALESSVEPLRAVGRTITVECHGPANADAAVDTAAFRIAMEATTNAVRHANAGSVLIELNYDDGLVIEVTDDGTGIPATAQPGVGMTTMADRAEELGGTLSIGSADAEGTRVRAWLPGGAHG